MWSRKIERIIVDRNVRIFVSSDDEVRDQLAV